MSNKPEAASQASYAALQQRLLQAEGQIQALTQVLKYLTTALEVQHGLDAEALAKMLLALSWQSDPRAPAAQQLLQQLMADMAEARQSRLYKLLYDKYGLDIDLEALR